MKLNPCRRCKSNHIARERCIDGMTRCLDCSFALKHREWDMPMELVEAHETGTHLAGLVYKLTQENERMGARADMLVDHGWWREDRGFVSQNDCPSHPKWGWRKVVLVAISEETL